MSCTPIHLFTVRYPDGSTRRKAIPGNHRDRARCHARLKHKLPAGAEIIDATWRSDYRYIDHPSNSQPDYGTEAADEHAIRAHRENWINELAHPPTARVIPLYPATPARRAA